MHLSYLKMYKIARPDDFIGYGAASFDYSFTRTQERNTLLTYKYDSAYSCS